MGVSILLGTYNVPPPNPCCLRTDLVRGLCFISTWPELTRIGGAKGGNEQKMIKNCQKSNGSLKKIMFFPLKCYFWPKKGPCGNAHTEKKKENVKNCLKWVEIQPKKIIPLPIWMKIA